MAPNKRKILEAARKHVQKGAREKALKEFGRLLKLDPRDAKLRLEIGDAYRRWGDVDEAISAYTKVAEQYMQEGFDARAVAVFKQIQALDPERWNSYIPLAELYQRMGLDSEAVQALQVAADGLHKAGERREALDLLRRMASLDPTNTTSRVKVADLLRQEEMDDEAVAEYEAAHAELQRQGETEPAATVLERILEIDPNRVSALAELGRNLLGQGHASRAEPFLKRAIEHDPDETGHYELLADAQRAQGRDDELEATYRSLAEIYRRRGDEDEARGILQRFVSPDDLAQNAEAPGLDAQPLEVEPLPTTSPADDTSLGDSLAGDSLSGPALDTGGLETGDLEAGDLDIGEFDADGEALLDDDLLDEELPGPIGGAASIAPGGEPGLPPDPVEALAAQPALQAPTGDPEQLLAEASVYLRYGKRAQALQNLNGILECEPGHREALEKLGEAHADGGEIADAVVAWVRAAHLAHAACDAPGLDALRGRVSALDTAAGAALPTLDAAAAPATAEPVPAAAPEAAPVEIDVTRALDESASEFEFDVEASTPGESAAEFELEVAASTGPVDLADDHEIEIEIDEDLSGQPPTDEPSLEGADELPIDPGSSQPEGLSWDDAEFSAEPPEAPAVEADAGEASISLQDAARENTLGDAGASLPVTASVDDELEEADFYRQQGMLDEAREVYRRVLERAPNHPLAQVRLGEIEEAAPPEPPPAEPLAPARLGEIEDAAPPELSPAEAAVPEPAPTPEIAAEPVPDVADELFVEGDVAGALGESIPDATAAELTLEAGEAPAHDDDPAGASYDLAAELSGFFDGAPGAGASAASTRSALASDAEQDVFGAIFAEFKRGVSEQLGDGDVDARYDLGIAYREMGLLEDAIAEFEIAVASESRRLECQHLLGLCNLDLGRGAAAVTQLEAALGSVAGDTEQATALGFDLGRAYESLGRIDDARGAWEAVAAVDPAFGEVGEKLAALESKPEDAVPVAVAADGMESFEEFFDDDDEATGEIEVGQAFESFEDIISEANDEAQPAANGAAPEPEVLPEAAVEPVAEPPAEPPKRRKKKISFV